MLLPLIVARSLFDRVGNISTKQHPETGYSGCKIGIFPRYSCTVKRKFQLFSAISCTNIKKKHLKKRHFQVQIKRISAIALYNNNRWPLFGQGGFEPPTPWSRTKCASLCATIRQQEKVYLKEYHLSILYCRLCCFLSLIK